MKNLMTSYRILCLSICSVFFLILNQNTKAEAIDCMLNTDFMKKDTVVEVCPPNTSFIFMDSLLTHSGNYDFFQIDSMYKDTMIYDTVYLTHDTTYTIYDIALVPQDTTYTIYDTLYTALDTIYTVYDTTHWSLSLFLKINYIGEIYDTVCFADLPYWAGDSALTASGEYRFDYGAVSDAYCDSSIVYYLTVSPPVEVEILGEHLVCDSSAVLQIPHSEIFHYSWSTGDTAEQITIHTSGEYIVTASNEHACTAVDAFHIQLIPKPVLSFADTFYICPESILTITAQKAAHYQWSTGDSTATVSLTQAGMYYLTAYNHLDCPVIDSFRIVHHAVPQLHINQPVRRCDQDSILLTATDANDMNTRFLWSNGKNNDSIYVNTLHTAIYKVIATTSFGCIDSSQIKVIARDTFCLKLEKSGIACSGDEVLITASRGGNYVWSTGETTANIVVTSSGTYSVTATRGTEIQEAELLVLFTPKPQTSITASGNTTFCSGDSVNLQAAGSGYFRWNTGDTSSLITVKTFGNYQVTITDAKGCTGSATQTVIVNPRPNIAVNGDTEICQGSQTILTVSGGTSYEWNNSSTSDMQILTPTNTSLYAVTATNSDGCKSSKTITVNVRPNPTAAIVGNTEICEGNSTTLIADGADHFLWSTGATTSAINVSSSARYSVTVSNDYGCSASTFQMLTVHPTPNPVVLGEYSFCQGTSTQLSVGGVMGGTYLWNTGASTASITVGTSGTYSVTVSNNYNCQKSVSQQVQVLQPATVRIEGNRNFCENSSTTLTAIGTPSDLTYVWSNGETDASITVSTAGTYTVTATNAIGCQTVTSVVVQTKPKPNPNILGNTTLCQGESTNLTITPTTGYAFLWNDNSTNSVLNVNTTGTYTVTVTGTNACSEIATATVIVNPLPNIQINGVQSICRGESTTLIASGATTYQWTSGQTTTSFIEVSPNNTASYTVIGTNAQGCTSNKTTTVTVNPVPSASIVGNQNLCVGSQLEITANGGDTYLWSNAQTTPTVTINSSGIYYVTVTSNSGCSAVTSHTVVSRSLPTVQISGNRNICAGENTILTASGGASYIWSNGGNSSNVTLSNSGEYFVTATDAYGCQGVNSAILTVYALPQFTIGGLSAFCAGNSVALTASGDAGLNYQWNTGSELSYISVSTGGTYSVTATNANQCQAYASKTVIQNAVPNAIISGNTTICPATPTVLTASGGTQYLWSNGASTATVNVSPSYTTTYTVTVTNEANCTTIQNHTININPVPNISFSGNTSFCSGNLTSITAQGGSSYQWSIGQINPTISINAAGIYTVTSTNSLGCTASNSIQIIENPLPQTQISGNTSICVGSATVLTAQGGNTYLWNTGVSGAVLNITPSQTTAYSVTISNAQGCSVTQTSTVTVNLLPDANIVGITNACEGTPTVLTASGGNTYLWNTGEITANKTVSSSGTYTITVTNAQGCSQSVSHPIIFHSLPVPQISGTTIFCEGNSTTLSASGGTAYIWNTGATTSYINTNTAGQWTVTVSNAQGCSATTSENTTILSAPNISISGETSICAGSTTNLIASGGLAYEWNTGDLISSINVNPTTTTDYTVTVSNYQGCSSTKTITVIVYPSYQDTLIAQICQGVAYNGQGFDIPVQDTAGLFYFSRKHTSVHGCDSIRVLALTVKSKPILTEGIKGNEFIYQHGTYTYVIDGALHANAYQWTISNPYWSLSSTNSNYVNLIIPENSTSQEGTLRVVAANECGISTEAKLSILKVAVNEYPTEKLILIYPNPVHNQLRIKNYELREGDIIEIYDIFGRVIKTGYTPSLPNSEPTIDVSQLPAGIYILRIGNSQGKFVKQ